MTFFGFIVLNAVFGIMGYTLMSLSIWMDENPGRGFFNWISAWLRDKTVGFMILIIFFVLASGILLFAFGAVVFVITLFVELVEGRLFSLTMGQLIDKLKKNK